MNIYIGNLTKDVISQDLHELFETFGEVTSVKIITDRYTGESRGFGFIEMANQNEGEAAIAELNSKELKGQTLKVNEARPREQNQRRGGGGGDNRDRGY
jgi:RNA recognition motif-containing protein